MSHLIRIEITGDDDFGAFKIVRAVRATNDASQIRADLIDAVEAAMDTLALHCAQVDALVREGCLVVPVVKVICAWCGNYAAGEAFINDERYCHGDAVGPSCYELAQWEAHLDSPARVIPELAELFSEPDAFA